MNDNTATITQLNDENQETQVVETIKKNLDLVKKKISKKIHQKISKKIPKKKLWKCDIPSDLVNNPYVSKLL